MNQFESDAVDLLSKLVALEARLERAEKRAGHTHRTDMTDAWAFDGAKTTFACPAGQKPVAIEKNGVGQRRGGSQVSFTFDGSIWSVVFVTAPLGADWADLIWEWAE